MLTPEEIEALKLATEKAQRDAAEMKRIKKALKKKMEEMDKVTSREVKMMRIQMLALRTALHLERSKNNQAGESYSPRAWGPADEKNQYRLPHNMLANRKRRVDAQQQLLLFLHTSNCMRQQQANGQKRQCNLPYCKVMETVLRHMSTCKDDKSCTNPHYRICTRLINHWKHCNSSECPVCSTLRDAAKDWPSSIGAADDTEMSPEVLQAPSSASDLERLLQSPATIEEKTNDASSQSTSAGAEAAYDQAPGGALARAELEQILKDSVICSALSVSIKKEWHQAFTRDARNSNVKKLIRAIHAKQTLESTDFNLFNVIQCGRQMEYDVFNNCKSGVEYTSDILFKVDNFKKELDEELLKREEKQQQLLQTQQEKYEQEFNRFRQQLFLLHPQMMQAQSLVKQPEPRTDSDKEKLKCRQERQRMYNLHQQERLMLLFKQ